MCKAGKERLIGMLLEIFGDDKNAMQKAYNTLINHLDDIVHEDDDVMKGKVWHFMRNNGYHISYKSYNITIDDPKVLSIGQIRKIFPEATCLYYCCNAFFYPKGATRTGREDPVYTLRAYISDLDYVCRVQSQPDFESHFADLFREKVYELAKETIDNKWHKTPLSNERHLEVSVDEL